MEKWVISAKRADFNQIGQQFHIDPVIARLIRNRDVIGEDKIREYLSGTVQELPSPWLMKDMEKAVDILEKKISQKAKVRIIGDYDIDGDLYIHFNERPCEDRSRCGYLYSGQSCRRIWDSCTSYRKSGNGPDRYDRDL